MTKKRVNFLASHDNCNKRTRAFATVRLGKTILVPINPSKEKKKRVWVNHWQYLDPIQNLFERLLLQ